MDKFIPGVLGKLPAIDPVMTQEYVSALFGSMLGSKYLDRLYEVIDEIVEAFEGHGLPRKLWRRDRVEP